MCARAYVAVGSNNSPIGGEGWMAVGGWEQGAGDVCVCVCVCVHVCVHGARK